MATMNTLTCSDSVELCRDIILRGRCWCLRCARYSYIAARFPQGEREPVRYVTTSSISLTAESDGDSQLTVRVDGYLVECELRADRTVCGVAVFRETDRSFIDYSGIHPDDLFKRYTGMTITQVLRYRDRLRAKRARREVAMFGRVASMGVL